MPDFDVTLRMRVDDVPSAEYAIKVMRGYILIGGRKLIEVTVQPVEPATANKEPSHV